MFDSGLPGGKTRTEYFGRDLCQRGWGNHFCAQPTRPINHKNHEPCCNQQKSDKTNETADHGRVTTQLTDMQTK